jgi:lipid-binding SYLF domain-containing protein
MLQTKQAGMRFVFATALALLTTAPSNAVAATAAEIDADASHALAKLYREIPAAETLAKKAKAVLIFPSVVKGGLIVGGQYGDGALRKGGKTVGYYNTAAVSYGLQAGAQTFGYVLLFMTDSALKYLDRSEGWEIGVGPSVVVLDEGMAKTLTTTTAQDDIYAFIFGQKGLMAGLGLQGSKITRIDPDK